MGHEVPGMRGVYKHIAPEWRTDLISGLQRTREESLTERVNIARRSVSPLLDRLLAGHRKDITGKSSGPTLLPESDIAKPKALGRFRTGPLAC
jgi:hypothetical protein